jgi:hypothetical protein
VSRSLKGVDPSLVGPRGEGDDHPRLFTLNYAEILGFEPAHDPDHDHVGETRPRGSDPLEAFGGPKVVPELDRLDLVQTGSWG